METKSTHRSFVIVDIEGFGRRSSTDQRWLRQQMYHVLHTALEDAGVDRSCCDAMDRGDSVILLVPASVSKSGLTDTFIERLDRELARYARRSTEPVRMRMRLALHSGEVSQDEQGWVGTDLNTACRLVDLDEARRALQQATEANLVVMVSEPWYSSIVRQDPELEQHLGFRRVPFVAKDVDEHAWLHVRSGPRAGTEPVTEQRLPAGGAPAPRPSGGMQFHGAVQATNIVQGDQANFHDGTR